ncbi:unnamed protein product [Vitrella brassicaformis CCMP3155]|uniref:DM2 domain-containing protein n=3 Tax=Vitrella brassicaformis TaxID=1169539 RepID=A0A0G4GBY8_VITBC|nr:unnamed protein product [Vitrella brassicaformis CCMP3155]|eukprot:CEM26358.1 unnamed protein product [Vitrella brassicaformis CCMP3155]
MVQKKRRRRRRRVSAKKREAGRTSIQKPILLSAPLRAFLRCEERLSRPEVVKRLWQYVKDRRLVDPANGRVAVCDEPLRSLLNVPSFCIAGGSDEAIPHVNTVLQPHLLYHGSTEDGTGQEDDSHLDSPDEDESSGASSGSDEPDSNGDGRDGGGGVGEDQASSAALAPHEQQQQHQPTDTALPKKRPVKERADGAKRHKAGPSSAPALPPPPLPPAVIDGRVALESITPSSVTLHVKAALTARLGSLWCHDRLRVQATAASTEEGSGCCVTTEVDVSGLRREGRGGAGVLVCEGRGRLEGLHADKGSTLRAEAVVFQGKEGNDGQERISIGQEIYLPPRTGLEVWSTGQVASMLRLGMDLPELAAACERFGVDGKTFSRFNEHDLRGLGLTAPFLIARVLDRLNELTNPSNGAGGRMAAPVVKKEDS